MSNKSIKKLIKKARAKDEDQQEEARRAIKQKADRFNNTDYGPTVDNYTEELSTEDIEKRTCSFCGNRFPQELQTQSVEKFYKRGKKQMSYKPPRMIDNRVCPSPSCRRTVLGDTMVIIHNTTDILPEWNEK